VLWDAVRSVLSKTQLTMEEFLGVWANRTTDAGDAVWKGMLVSENSSTGSSGISFVSASALFDETKPYSLLDSSWKATKVQICKCPSLRGRHMADEMAVSYPADVAACP